MLHLTRKQVKTRGYKVAPFVGRVKYLVSCDHPSGRRKGEYGVNQFWFTNVADAAAKCNEMLAAGQTGVDFQRQTEIRFIPARCTVERSQYKWETVFKA